MWDLWCIKWNWDRIYSEFFGFTLLVPFTTASCFFFIFRLLVLRTN